MGVSVKNENIDNKRAILSIAKRRLADLCKRSPHYKKYCEQIKMQREAAGKASVVCKIKPHLGSSAFDMSSGCTEACVGQSVLDILARRPKLFSFKEASDILAHCNWNLFHPFVKDIIQRYGIIITGLPQCAEEDLDLAVYFFIEDMFGIQPKLEFCTKLYENGEFGMIGVVFESIDTKQQIFEKIGILEGSGIEIDRHFSITWIQDYLNPPISEIPD